MDDDEREALKRLEQRIGGDPEPMDTNASAQAIEYAKSHVFERKSVVPERQFMTTALWHAVNAPDTTGFSRRKVCETPRPPPPLRTPNTPAGRAPHWSET